MEELALYRNAAICHLLLDMNSWGSLLIPVVLKQETIFLIQSNYRK